MFDFIKACTYTYFFKKERKKNKEELEQLLLMMKLKENILFICFTFTKIYIEKELIKRKKQEEEKNFYID